MNCKKGDLAVIIKSVDGLNVGRIVEVLDYLGEHSKYGPIWHVRTRGRALITEYGAMGPECDCADDWLRPIEPEAGQSALEVPHKLLEAA